MLVRRTFHPVGQGAFYSERHVVDGRPFNIVYDCGNRGCMPLVRPVVCEAFCETDTIDFLFISHFDFDHVSLISDLKPFQKKRIKTVVLPLLYPNVRYALAGYYLSTADRRSKMDLRRQIKLVLNPKEYFRESNLCYVIPAEETGSVDNQTNINSQREGDSVFGRLEKVERTIGLWHEDLCDIDDWILVPYNYDYKNHIRPLMQKLLLWLDSKGARIEDLGRIDFVTKVSNRRDLRRIYQKFGSGINENSMLLYSGPRSNIFDHLDVGVQCSSQNIARCERAGCIYTGDANLKQIDLSRVYKQYMLNVGTIQVPHHGSKYSFCRNHFPAKSCICPISYGKKNCYRHPDVCVKRQIENLGGVCILVTERRQTELMESIQGWHGF